MDKYVLLVPVATMFTFCTVTVSHFGNVMSLEASESFIVTEAKREEMLVLKSVAQRTVQFSITRAFSPAVSHLI